MSFLSQSSALSAESLSATERSSTKQTTGARITYLADVMSRVSTLSSVASSTRALTGLVLAALALGAAAGAQTRTLDEVFQCTPCLAVDAAGPAEALQLSRRQSGSLDQRSVWVRYPISSRGNPPGVIDELTSKGLLPWLRAPLQVALPVLQNTVALDRDLQLVVEALKNSPPGTVVQLQWSPVTAPGDSAGEALGFPADFAFLIKRAAVAITGAAPDAKVLIGPLRWDPEAIRTLFEEEVAAYVDGIVFEERVTPMPGEALALLTELDPDSLLVSAGIAVQGDGRRVAARAAERAAAGVRLVSFDLRPEQLEAALPMIEMLASQLSGDVSYDPYSSPASTSGSAWSFVRGKDLSLRVIAEFDETGGEQKLSFSDRLLTSPNKLDPGSSDPEPLFGGSRSRTGYVLSLSEVPEAMLISLERQGAEALEGVEGVADRVTVEDERQMPVEEILRRLQAFEDDQARRLKTYSAIQSSSLRFQLGTGVQSVDVTFRGELFLRQGQPSDWAWEDMFVNGVRWRGKSIPEIPLIQPEKATAQPLEISFTKEYRYRLRGTNNVNGRDAWVIDFEPAIKVEPGRSLFQGTVWVDRELYARVRTRAVQLGLEGEVLSNEETLNYSPIDELGRPTPWETGSYWLPLQLIGQQLYSLLNATVVVEREVLLSDIKINGGDFETRRQAKLQSPVTMVRDTNKGLRYLVAEGDAGERVVQDELDKTRFFLVGGLFYDKAQDYPLPLVGLNWLAFDWRGTGTQANLFFAGPLITANISNPKLFGSKFDGGINVFGLAIAGTDSIFRNNLEVPEEDVRSLRPNIDLLVGRPLGNFVKLDFEYSLGWNKFNRGDNTADEFVMPRDHLDHRFSLFGKFNRSGYRLRVGGSHNIRSTWEEWGLPGNTEFDPDQDSYTTYSASLGKTWHLPKFTKLGIEMEYLDGENLDRFSKYQFGFFSDVRVHGYRSDRVRAEQATAAHLSYGFNLADIYRVDLVLDSAWATDAVSGLDNEFLGGVGLVGTFIGPWSTIVNFDIGVPVAGPDDGVSVFVAFLKLFK